MKIALITGGSSGIGLSMTKRFIQNGYWISWVTLSEEEAQLAKKQLLEEFPQAVITYLIQDLSLPGAPKKTYDWVKSNNRSVDVLINNAGFGTHGLSPTIDMDKEVNMIELNVISLYKMTRLFLTEMIANDEGAIINISSSSSFQPEPRMATFAATKAFIAHYSQALSEELKELNSKVKVITVCPAPISDTKFPIAAKMEKVKLFDGITSTTKDEVADDVWKGFKNGKDYIVIGAKLRRLKPLNKTLPRFIINSLMKRELTET
jgi:short-subunit dehydrogenase